MRHEMAMDFARYIEHYGGPVRDYMATWRWTVAARAKGGWPRITLSLRGDQPGHGRPDGQLVSANRCLRTLTLDLRDVFAGSGHPMERWHTLLCPSAGREPQGLRASVPTR